MARFVLVHGGWHGGWCFRRLARELEDRGHEVAAPEAFVESFGGAVRDTSGRSYWPERIRLRRGFIPTVRAGSPTGPSRNSVRKLGSSRFPRRSGPTTWSSRPCATPRSTLTGRFERPAATAHVLIELDSGHSPFLTQPAELADILSSLD